MTKEYKKFEQLYEENKNIIHMPLDRNYPLNYKKGKEWANSQCDDESVEFANAIINSTIYISYEEFYKELKKVAISFNKTYFVNKYKKDKFILILPECMYKSSMWVTLLSYKYIRNIITDIHYDITAIYNSTLDSKSPNYKKSIKCIICDDCSYTGDQLEEMVRIDYQKLNYRNKTKEPDVYDKKWIEWDRNNKLEAEKQISLIDSSKFSVNIIIPYMSTISKNKMKKYPYVKLPSSLNVFPTFPQIHNIQNIQPDILQEFRLTFVYHEKISAVYFDHKVADTISTFHKIYLLAPLFNCSEFKNSRIPFIDGCGNSNKIHPEIDIYDISLTYENSDNKYGVCPLTFYKSLPYKYNGKTIPKKNLISTIFL